MQALTDDFKAEYPGVVVYGKGDRAHELRVSDHNEDDTPGVRAAQSDADSDPEHRAIDVMLGPAFSASQAQARIDQILSDARLRARLWYINFQNWQWSRSNGWVRRDNSRDPHPTHVHFSGWVTDDENGAPWFRTGGVTDVFCMKDDNGVFPSKGPNVGLLQRKIVYLGGSVGPKGVDLDYGGDTARGLASLIGGTGEVYGDEEAFALDLLVAAKAGSGKSGGLVPHVHIVPGASVSITGSGTTASVTSGAAVAS